MEERPYQEITVRKAEWALRGGKRTLIVAPTGAGKTCIGAMLARRDPGRVGWLTHTKDLIEQTSDKLRSYGLDVGIVAAGRDPRPFARVQVASIQTLVERETELAVDMLVLDECHHFLAIEWRAAMERCQARRLLGLTATPERGDGRALGDIFDELIVAAHYSELIHAGYLVPLRVLRPARELERGLARKVIQAYQENGEARPGFAFVRSIKEANERAEEACAAGIPSAVVEAGTSVEERRTRLGGLRVGDLRLLWNVHALTEGVDVPSASLCAIARNMGHVSVMLQAAGRVLRAHPGKTDALMLDLPGITHRHGLPTEDREYSLHGQGIRRTEKGMSLRLCVFCGMTSESGGPCPRCGVTAEPKKTRAMKIYNEELRAVFAGGSTPDWAMRAELDRLRVFARSRGYELGWVAKQYELLFGKKPVFGDVADSDEKRAQYEKLVIQARAMGYHVGWASHRYKVQFGTFPPRAWTLRAESAA